MPETETYRLWQAIDVANRAYKQVLAELFPISWILRGGHLFCLGPVEGDMDMVKGGGGKNPCH